MKTFPSLTLALIAICVAIAAMMQFGSEEEILRALSIANPDSLGLEQIKAGEVWRLLTPAFIHFGPVHLLFNMIWLWDLGRMIEAKRGSFFLGGFVVVIGIASNLAQFFAAGPTFGGMSGVIYGMLAYVFMQMRTDANSGYVLHKFDVITSVGWFFLCWIGALGSIANWAHSTGLIGGLAWSYLETQLARRLEPQPDQAGRGRLARLSNFIPLGIAISALALVLAIMSMRDHEMARRCVDRTGVRPDRRIAICSAILETNRRGIGARSRALIGRGDAYRDNGQYDLATQDYDAAIDLDPTSVRALAGLGLAKLNNGNTADGKADIGRARQMDPEVGEVYPELRYREMADEALAGVDLHDAAAVGTAMRGVVRRILMSLPPSTLPDEVPNERLIAFRTDASGVSIPPRLRALYPQQMSILLQYQYRDLAVRQKSFSVTLSFGQVSETLSIPFAAMTDFEDRTVNFWVHFSDVAPAVTGNAKR
ncbi:TPR repeat-containing protein [Bradyrhizobium lablabi]|uniref:TPR repeat-containing protein n=1 Tax=Bradyrhizobium lablabi TaxID=722472 RepID=A0A1M6S192_9BRAD|nr:ClpXP protease specificity-enhancing factor SspB [Bradyrhizobium lablabi]SHK38298.1 TPR repeat-containing protein [Bradyrhizobium lablabi]